MEDLFTEPEGRKPSGEVVLFNRKKKPPSTWRIVLGELGALIVKIATIVLALLALFAFVFGVHRNTEKAMEPLIRDGDLVFYYRLDKTLKAQDVVVLDYGGELQTRRVVAVAGDTVDVTEHGLMINGSYMDEPDIYSDTERFTAGTDFPLTVGQGQVFVLGDNRENAEDSRIYGCVDFKDIYGKVMMVLRRRNI